MKKTRGMQPKQTGDGAEEEKRDVLREPLPEAGRARRRSTSTGRGATRWEQGPLSKPGSPAQPVLQERINN